MAYISLDNGNSFLTAEQAIVVIDENNLWDIVVYRMDDETRENYCCYSDDHMKMLKAYLDHAENNLVI